MDAGKSIWVGMVLTLLSGGYASAGPACHGMGCPIAVAVDPRFFRGSLEGTAGHELDVEEAPLSTATRDDAQANRWYCKFQYFVPKDLAHPFGSGTLVREAVFITAGTCMTRLYYVIDKVGTYTQARVFSGNFVRTTEPEGPHSIFPKKFCVWHVPELNLDFRVSWDNSACSAQKNLVVLPKPIEAPEDKVVGTVRQ